VTLCWKERITHFVCCWRLAGLPMNCEGNLKALYQNVTHFKTQVSFYMLASHSGFMVIMLWCFIFFLLICKPLFFPASYMFCFALSMLIAVCWWAGRFLGELTKQVFSDLSASKYQVHLCPTCSWFLCMDIDSGFLNLFHIFQWYLNLQYWSFFVKYLKSMH